MIFFSYKSSPRKTCLVFDLYLHYLITSAICYPTNILLEIYLEDAGGAQHFRETTYSGAICPNDTYLPSVQFLAHAAQLVWPRTTTSKYYVMTVGFSLPVKSLSFETDKARSIKGFKAV